MPDIFIITLLFFCLTPVGFFLAYKAYKLGRTFFDSNNIIVEMPFSKQEIAFKLEKDGKYSIWQKGKQLSKTPVEKFKPQITNTDTNKIIPISISILRPHVNGFTWASTELFNFRATAGNYKLEITNGSSIGMLEKMVSKPFLLFASDFDPDKYFLQIKKRLNPLRVVGLVWLIIFSIAFITGGLVLGLTAEQIFAP